MQALLYLYPRSQVKWRQWVQIHMPVAIIVTAVANTVRYGLEHMTIMVGCWRASTTLGAEARVRPATSVHNLKWRRRNSPMRRNKPTERTVATMDST